MTESTWAPNPVWDVGTVTNLSDWQSGKFPLTSVDHFGETSSVNAGQLFMLCVTTSRKELFFPAVVAFFHLLNKMDIMEEDKRKFVRRIEERIELFN